MRRQRNRPHPSEIANLTTRYCHWDMAEQLLIAQRLIADLTAKLRRYENTRGVRLTKAERQVLREAAVEHLDRPGMGDVGEALRAAMEKLQ